MRFRFSILVAAITLPTAAQRAPLFKSEILPVLEKNCVQCHGKALLGQQHIPRLAGQQFEYLKMQLERFGLAEEFRKFQKEFYYYRAQVEEYKQQLQNPSKLEAKLVEMAARIPAFREFFNRNSLLAQMFGSPGTDPSNYAISFAGLQTRAGLMQNLQERFGTGPAVFQVIRGNMQSGLSDLE